MKQSKKEIFMEDLIAVNVGYHDRRLGVSTIKTGPLFLVLSHPRPFPSILPLEQGKSFITLFIVFYRLLRCRRYPKTPIVALSPLRSSQGG
jgi:hypothetical protein